MIPSAQNVRGGLEGARYGFSSAFIPRSQLHLTALPFPTGSQTRIMKAQAASVEKAHSFTLQKYSKQE